MFKACFLAWISDLRDDDPDIIAVDGKTSRRSHDKRKGRNLLHLVSAWAARQRIVLGQQATEEKSNEITAIPLLLKHLDLKGALVTMDAMGTQTDIARAIRDGGGDYCMSLKKNWPAVYADVEQLFNEPPDNVTFETNETVDLSGGRIETRRHTNVFEKYGFTRIGLAGYPEGHPRIAQPALEDALAARLALLRQTKIQAHVVTQFGFEAQPVLRWLLALQAREPSLPVRIGLAGPAGIATLARYAVRCGIGHSINALTRHGTSIARLVTEAGPEAMLRQLAATEVTAASIHLFSFGGLVRTARWLRAVTDGDFRISDDETGFIVAD